MPLANLVRQSFSPNERSSIEMAMGPGEGALAHGKDAHITQAHATHTHAQRPNIETVLPTPTPVVEQSPVKPQVLEASAFTRCAAAILYASSSMGILWINKIILTTYKFPSPSFLAMSQAAVSLVAMIVLKFLGIITFPDIGFEPMKAIMPLPFIHMINVLSGLSGTKFVTLPMLTALRRFSILLTMVGEFFVFGKGPTRLQQSGVALMCVGAMIAASNDLSFHFFGYMAIFINDIATAAMGVMTRQKTDLKNQLGGASGVLFYNTLFGLPLMAMWTFTSNADTYLVWNYSEWRNPWFLTAFFLSTISGGVVNFATIWSTKINSATTTVVIGCLKNTVIAYIGMCMADYVFSGVNFWGINISISGALVYSYIEFTATKKPAPTPIAPQAASEASPGAKEIDVENPDDSPTRVNDANGTMTGEKRV